MLKEQHFIEHNRILKSRQNMFGVRRSNIISINYVYAGTQKFTHIPKSARCVKHT